MFARVVAFCAPRAEKFLAQSLLKVRRKGSFDSFRRGVAGVVLAQDDNASLLIHPPMCTMVLEAGTKSASPM